MMDSSFVVLELEQSFGQPLHENHTLRELHFAAMDHPSNMYGLACAWQLAGNNNNTTAESISSHETGAALAFAICNKVNEQDVGENCVVCLQIKPDSEIGEIISKKSVSIAGLPVEASLVSVAALSEKRGTGSVVILGITFVRTDNQQAALILCELCGTNESVLVPTRERVVNLPFVPFGLTAGSPAGVGHGFTLSGSNTLFFFPVIELKNFSTSSSDLHALQAAAGVTSMAMQWPEVSPVKHCVTSFASRDVNDCRVIAIGCQNGTCQLTVSTQSGIKIEHEVKFDGPITSVELFDAGHEAYGESLHLLVGCAVEAAVLYCDVIQHGLHYSSLLPESNNYDSVLCVRAMDVNFDGSVELLVGTYGQKLLGYELDLNRARDLDGSSKVKEPIYRLAWRRNFAHPVYSIEKYDIMCDGMSEVIVLTMLGLHVLQIDERVEHLIGLLGELQRLESVHEQQEAEVSSSQQQQHLDVVK